MSRSACIIPLVGNTEGLETTLVSVLERRPDGCEVLVVLNVPYHDPFGLQGEIQILERGPKPGWSSASTAAFPQPKRRLCTCWRRAAK